MLIEAIALPSLFIMGTPKQLTPYRYPCLYKRGTFKTQALLVLFLPFLVVLAIFGSLLRLSAYYGKIEPPFR